MPHRACDRANPSPQRAEITLVGKVRNGTMNHRITILKSMIVFVAILPLWAFVAPFLVERLIVTKPMDHADAILVLAGSRAYFERTRKAAFLYKEGVAPSVLLTNDGKKASWSRKEQRNPPYVELAKRSLVAHGVPEHAIEILSPEVSGTIAEAQLLGKQAAQRRWKSLLIVTSPNHTRRALRTFESVFTANGVETQIGIAPAPNEEQTPPASYWWLTASGWRDVAGEYVKSAYYYFAY